MATQGFSNRTKLTKKHIDGLRCPPDRRRLEVPDTEIRGLAVFVTAGGAATFYLSKNIGGRLRRWRLGDASVMLP